MTSRLLTALLKAPINGGDECGDVVPQLHACRARVVHHVAAVLTAERDVPVHSGVEE
jgi:DNA-binding FrmR family transcriptional regulator